MGLKNHARFVLIASCCRFAHNDITCFINSMFKVVLYSSEVEGEFCRERVLTVKMKPDTEYEYIDSGFYSMLNEEGDRNFWIEIVPLEDKE